MMARLRNLIAPPRCMNCTLLLEARAIFCEQCVDLVTPVVSTEIPLTSRHYMSVFAAGSYHGLIKKLILAKHGSHQLAGSHLGEIVWYRTPVSTQLLDYIVPIPLHWTRKLYRGFNQADEMCNALSSMSGKPVVHLLRRTRRTRFQASLSAQERAANVADVFALMPGDASLYYGKHLLLVDDLMTTGATLTMAGRQLLKLKPASLVCCVAARTI